MSSKNEQKKRERHSFASDSDSLSVRTVGMSHLVSANVCSDYPDLAVQRRLTRHQNPGRELPGGYTLLFYTCLTKKSLKGEQEKNLML